MRTGVIYLFHPRKRINGTLFYCAEYYSKLLELGADVTFYVIGMSDNDFEYVFRIFHEKYNRDIRIVQLDGYTDIHKLKLEKTLILDIRTFHYLKEFLTGDIHVFANEKHEMFRYKNERTVTYYGSYEYQDYDVFNYLKLNFGIFRPVTKGNGVFVSSLNPGHVQKNIQKYQQMYGKPVHIKNSITGRGDIFSLVDHIHYIHTGLDTNNRTIPEALYFGLTVTIDNYIELEDSVQMRYDDIQANGFGNYTLTSNDEMIKACLKYSN